MQKHVRSAIGGFCLGIALTIFAQGVAHVGVPTVTCSESVLREDEAVGRLTSALDEIETLLRMNTKCELGYHQCQRIAVELYKRLNPAAALQDAPNEAN